MLQISHTYYPPRTLDGAHEPVSSADAAVTVCGILHSSPAKVGPAMGVLPPVRCVTVRAAVSVGVHRLPAAAGADGARSGWDRDCKNTKYGLGWARAVTSAASLLSKSRLVKPQSSFPTSAPVGVQPSGLCRHPAPGSTAPIGNLGGFSNSSENLASPAPSSCFLRGLLNLGGSLSASWLMAAQSNRPLQVWKNPWSRRPTNPSRRLCGWETAA